MLKKIIRVTYKACLLISLVSIVLAIFIGLNFTGPGVGIAVGIVLVLPGVVLGIVGILTFLIYRFLLDNKQTSTNDATTQINQSKKFFSETSQVLILVMILITAAVLWMTV